MIPHATYAAFARELVKLAEATSLIKRRFDKLCEELDTRGVLSGTGHKRISIPKTVLSEKDLQDLGFVPVMIAVPEAGQSSFRSFRHPDNNYHLHEHGDHWTMHKDDHASSTMLVRKLFMQEQRKKPGKGKGGKSRTSAGVIGKAALEFLKGTPHVLTEGVPGMYYYAKGKIVKTPGMAERLSAELPREYFRKIRRWRPSEN